MHAMWRGDDGWTLPVGGTDQVLDTVTAAGATEGLTQTDGHREVGGGREGAQVQGVVSEEGVGGGETRFAEHLRCTRADGHRECCIREPAARRLRGDQAEHQMSGETRGIDRESLGRSISLGPRRAGRDEGTLRAVGEINGGGCCAKRRANIARTRDERIHLTGARHPIRIRVRAEAAALKSKG